MLAMWPDCERCGCDLPADTLDARMCSMECTFCAECAEGPLGGLCPNCEGTFAPRPTRRPELLARFPAARKAPR